MMLEWVSDKMLAMPKKRNPFNVAVGKRLQALRIRIAAKSKVREFAQFLGINEDTYRAWEKGDNCLPPHVADDLCARFDVTTDYFYRGDPGGLPVRVHEKLRGVA